MPYVYNVALASIQVDQLEDGHDVTSGTGERTSATFIHEGQLDCYLNSPRPVLVHIAAESQTEGSRLFVPYDSRCFHCFINQDDKVSCARRRQVRRGVY